MKKFTLLFTTVLCFLWAGTQISKAQLLMEENFNFTGFLVDNGWTAHSGAGNLSIQTNANNLSFAGYASSGIGNEAAIDTTGEDVSRNFTEQTAGAVYVSFLVNVVKATATGDYFLHLAPTTIGTTFRSRVHVKYDSGTDKIAFGISKSTNTPDFTAFDYDLATTYLLVMKYQFVNGSDDTSYLFVNPVINGIEPMPLLTNTVAGGDLSNAGTIALRQGTGSSAPRLIIDGIRIGTSWTDVLPFTVTANSGIFETLIITNDGSNVYDISTIFEGKNFGNIPETSTFLFKGAQVKTWKHDPPDDVTGARMMYRIYEQGTSPLPAFDTITLPWNFNYPTPGDQLWQNDTLNINLAALPHGDYYFDVYFDATYTSGGTPAVHIDNNNGNNYKASFTITVGINTNNEPVSEKVFLYPNPAQNFVNINLMPQTHNQIDVFDMQGRLVFSERQVSTPSYILNTSLLDMGIYNVVVTANNTKQSLTLIVK